MVVCLRLQGVTGALYFELPYPLGRMENLSVQIRKLDRIAIHQAKSSYAGASEIGRCRTPETSETNKEH